MKLDFLISASAFTWVTAVCALGVAGHANSISSWTVLAAAGAVPSLVMMRYRHHPRQTMSQSIQEVLR